MLNQLKSFPKNIINVDPLRVAGIRHAMVADEHDIHDVSQVTSFQGVVKVFGEFVNISKDFVDKIRSRAS